MTDPVFLLEREWPLQQPRLAARLPYWRHRQPSLRIFGSPAQLLRFLHIRPPAETDAPLLALLALARTDRLAGRLVLQAILPALKSQAARLAEPAPREEVWELLLFFAWEAICAYPRERPSRVAANLVLQVLHDTTRELRRPQQRQVALEWSATTTPSEPAVDRVVTEALLQAAVAAGQVSERDAELILRTRVDGISLRLLARMQQVGYHALRQRRQRAERRLREHLARSGDVSNGAVLDLTSTAEIAFRRTPDCEPERRAA